MTKHIIFVARQAGSAAAFIPLIHALQKQNSTSCLIFALEQASSILINSGITHHSVKNFADALPNLLRARANLLITGTSFSATEDNQFWNWARISEIPSIAFIDHWINYLQRFSSTPNNLFDCLPDYLAVIDERMRQELSAAGAPESRIIVLGHPGWDQLSTWSGRNAPELKKQLAGDERRLIVFISEPLARFYGTTLGYTENDALALLCNTLKTLGGKYTIAVRPHPRQNPNEMILPTDIEPVQIRITTEARLELLAAADVITGMNSMLLYEATIIGRPVVALQPGCVIAADVDNCPGMLRVIHSEQALAALTQALTGQIETRPVPEPALPRWIKYLQTLTSQ